MTAEATPTTPTTGSAPRPAGLRFYTHPLSQPTSPRLGRRVRLVVSGIAMVATAVHVRHLHRIAEFWQAKSIRERGLVDLMQASGLGSKLVYPGNDGAVLDRDPTHGRIDYDIQWHVAGMHPESLAERVGLENTMQSLRNSGKQLVVDEPPIGVVDGAPR